jgi:hypothetical protein
MCLIVVPVPQMGATIEYRAVINRSVVGTDGSLRGTPSLFAFRAEVSPDRYRISRLTVSGLSCFDEMAGSDGIDCYLLQKQWPSWKEKELNVHCHEISEVTPGLFPTRASPETQLTWVVFASHRSLTNGQPIILSHISYAPYNELKADIKYPVKQDWPESVEVFSPGAELVLGKKHPLPPPFQSGYRLLDLFLETGETNGVAYPAKATFFQYSVFTDLVGTNAELRKILKIQITTTNISESSQPSGDYLPILSQTNLMALDFRYSPQIPRPGMGSVDAIQYRLPEGKWLSRTNRQVRASGASVRVETEVASRVANPSNKRHVIVLAVLFVVMCVFPLIMIRKTKHR